MKYKKFKEMQSSELNTKLEQLQIELIKLNAQVATGSAPKNPAMLKNTKKDIARIYTELAAREGRVNG